MILGLISETLVVEAKAHARVTQVLARIGWSKSQIYVDTTEIFVGRGKDVTLVSEGKRGVRVAKTSNGDSVKALMCSGEKKIKMWPYVKDYGRG